MQWHEFVFSKKPVHRLLRHSVFWAAWWMYFSLCNYLFQRSDSGELVDAMTFETTNPKSNLYAFQ